MKRILPVSVMLVAATLTVVLGLWLSGAVTNTKSTPVPQGMPPEIQAIWDKIDRTGSITNDEMIKFQVWERGQTARPSPTPAPIKKTPTPKPGSTADLQKQIDRLNQRISALEESTGTGRFSFSFGPSLESRVSDLESKVGGRYSFGGDSLSSLERRVSDLESKVGGRYSLGSGSLSSLERRVSALESKSGGSRW